MPLLRCTLALALLALGTVPAAAAAVVLAAGVQQQQQQQQQCAAEHGIDYDGHDMQPVKSLPAPDGAACCALCTSTTGCAAWTLQMAAGNPACPQNCCYLKTSASGRRSYKDSVSGTVGPLPPSV